MDEDERALHDQPEGIFNALLNGAPLPERLRGRLPASLPSVQREAAAVKQEKGRTQAAGRLAGVRSAAGRSSMTVEQCLESLGLLRRVWGATADQWRSGIEESVGKQLVAELRGKVQQQAAELTETARQASALHALLDFVHATDRVPFLDPRNPGASEYNQETLEMFAVWLREQGSRQRGKLGQHITADTVLTTVSQVRLAVERRQRCAITAAGDERILKLLGKRMRRGDVPRGDRKLSRGLRAQHLRELADMGYDRSSARGLMRWAAALVAHNMLLRGGELGTTDKKPFDPKRGLTVKDIVFHTPTAESKWRPFGVAWVVGSKDTEFRHRVVAMPFSRRATMREQPVVGADPLDVYDALLLLTNQRRAELRDDRVDSEATAPLFVGENGKAWTTNDSRDLAESMGSLLGIPAADIGGKCFRIGGATDLRALLGDSSQELIKQRGRWSSDVAKVYQRALVDVHLAMSSAMGSVKEKRDMEEMFRGWSQPSTFR